MLSPVDLHADTYDVGPSMGERVRVTVFDVRQLCSAGSQAVAELLERAEAAERERDALRQQVKSLDERLAWLEAVIGGGNALVSAQLRQVVDVATELRRSAAAARLEEP